MRKERRNIITRLVAIESTGGMQERDRDGDLA